MAKGDTWKSRENLENARDFVMNAPDAIKELYNMYSDEEASPQIVKLGDKGLRTDIDLEDRPVDLYLEL